MLSDVDHQTGGDIFSTKPTTISKSSAPRLLIDLRTHIRRMTVAQESASMTEVTVTTVGTGIMSSAIPSSAKQKRDDKDSTHSTDKGRSYSLYTKHA